VSAFTTASNLAQVLTKALEFRVCTRERLLGRPSAAYLSTHFQRPSPTPPCPCQCHALLRLRAAPADWLAGCKGSRIFPERSRRQLADSSFERITLRSHLPRACPGRWATVRDTYRTLELIDETQTQTLDRKDLLRMCLDFQGSGGEGGIR
jgi:hypothetical protein